MASSLLRHFPSALMLIGFSLVGLQPAGAEVLPASATYSLGIEAAYTQIYTGYQSAPQTQSGSFYGGTLDVSFTAFNTGLPYASAKVVSGGCTSSGCAGGFYSAYSKVDYHILVSGPSGRTVPYLFDTRGGTTATGNYFSGVEVVQLIAPGGSGTSGFYASSANQSGNLTCGSDGCVGSQQHANLLTNTDYTIELLASAEASTNSAANLSVWVDPYIHIDPDFVGGDQFKLLISDGVGNSPVSAVPEPSTWAMMLLGLCGLGWLAHRRRNTLSLSAA